MTDFNPCEHCTYCNPLYERDGWKVTPTDLFICRRKKLKRECIHFNKYEPRIFARLERRDHIVCELYRILEQLDDMAKILLVDRLTEQESALIKELAALC